MCFSMGHDYMAYDFQADYRGIIVWIVVGVKVLKNSLSFSQLLEEVSQQLNECVKS